jgi:hypothetical protein
VGVEREAASLVLPAEPTEKIIESDPAPWGVESDAVSLPYEKITESDPAPWGVESDVASLVLPRRAYPVKKKLLIRM